MIELRHLRYFQAVAEELSFSRAAERLRVAQPALSRAIKELENHLGTILLDRTRRRVSLTAAGRALLQDSGLLFQRLEEAFHHVQRIASGEEGELRLGYIGPPTQFFLGRLLREFSRLHPRVSVVLEERTPERVWEMVSQGRLAMGLTRPVLAQKALQLHTLLLRKEPLWAALPENHPQCSGEFLKWRDLKDEQLILLARREGVGLHDAILEACRSAQFTPNIAHTPSLMSTVLTYVESGAGIGILTDSVTSLGAGRPLRFLPLRPAVTVNLVMVWADQNDTPPARAFRSLVEQWLEAGELWRKPQSRKER